MSSAHPSLWASSTRSELSGRLQPLSIDFASIEVRLEAPNIKALHVPTVLPKMLPEMGSRAADDEDILSRTTVLHALHAVAQLPVVYLKWQLRATCVAMQPDQLAHFGELIWTNVHTSLRQRVEIFVIRDYVLNPAR